MKRFLLAWVIALALSQSVRAQNLILGSGSNGQISVTNFRGTSTVNNLTGLPLGTSDGSATGEVALKVITVGSTSTGTSSVSLTGTTRAWIAPSYATSGTTSFAAGLKSFDYQCLTGSGYFITPSGTSGIFTSTAIPSWNRDLYPDLYPAFSMVLYSGGTTGYSTTR